MQNNKQTLKDLSFTGADDGYNVLHLIDRCNTILGRELLQKLLSKGIDNFESLKAQQDAILYWHAHLHCWPKEISNGTIVMLEKFYEAADTYSGHPGGINLFGGKMLQKIFNRNEYHFTQFSLSHLSDFLKGCQCFVQLFEHEKHLPSLIKTNYEAIQKSLQHSLTADLISINKNTSFKEIVRLSFHARREMKSNIHELMHLFAQQDAWFGMAKASTEHKWNFPKLKTAEEVCYKAKKMYHPLLKNAIEYDIDFEKGSNFMLLTGANMSGKTTLMRTLGISAILSHIGMAVPAAEMQISFLEGVITNMHVEDDLFKGESFFLAEVKNMKRTAEVIAHSKGHLVLMDELFKGTNVHDAYECTKAIVAALGHYPNHIMILSTHLHEIAHYFQNEKGLRFYCFNTKVSSEGNFEFNYQLQQGISDEKIGYKILEKEGVVAILNRWKTS